VAVEIVRLARGTGGVIQIRGASKPEVEKAVKDEMSKIVAARSPSSEINKCPSGFIAQVLFNGKD